MPIHEPTPGQRFILKLAFGEDLSTRDMIQFTDPRNGTSYTYSEVEFYRLLVTEGRVRGPWGDPDVPRGILASLGRRSGKTTLIGNVARRCAERRISCSIATLSRHDSISENISELSREMRSFLRVSQDIDTRASTLIFDELAFNSQRVNDEFELRAITTPQVMVFSSPNVGSRFNQWVLNPPLGFVSVMMHTWEVMGRVPEYRSDFLGQLRADPAHPATLPSATIPTPQATPPAIPEGRRMISEAERFEQVISGLGEVGDEVSHSTTHRPPCDLYVVVNQEANDCLCVTSLDLLHSQERFKSDKVYRVLAVEEVEDPRVKLEEPALPEGPSEQLQEQYDQLSELFRELMGD